METKYYLCDKFGKYVAITGDGYAVLIAGNDIAETWDTAEAADADVALMSRCTGTECRVVAHVI